jgi:glycosyltransferase involved in cell wall biosynthesis
MASLKLVHITTVPETLFFLSGQVQYMKSRGFMVHGLSSPGEILDCFAHQEQITIHPVHMPRRITPGQDLLALLQITRLLRQLKPQIVHAHTPKGGLLGMMGASLARVPVRLYHIHGLPYSTASGLSRYLLRLSERVSCNLAQLVFCVSTSVKQNVVDDHICPESKIKVLCNGSINGVDAVNRFNPEKHSQERVSIRRQYKIPLDAMVLTFVGRIVCDKGVVELAQAWSTLREKFPNLYLLLVGPKESRDAVPEPILNKLRQDGRVHLVGRTWNTPAIFAAADLVVLPTYREGFPVVPLEAAAMTLPVVATSVPGCVDAVVDGVTGTLVPPRDSQALVQAIARYLNDSNLRSGHGLAGRERVLRDYCPEDIWVATYEEYIGLLRQKGLPIPEATQSRTGD